MLDPLQSLIESRPQPDGEARLALGNLRWALFRAASEPVEVGRYRLVRRIGAGAGGVVMQAHDPELDRDVAIKLLPPGDCRRRLREAQLLAQFSSPHVVEVLDVGVHDLAGEQAVYLAMELVAGETLRSWLERERRPWTDTLAVLIQAGHGLAHAHAAGIVHRDFKPDNVIIGANHRVRVVDFGLALQREQEPQAATTSGGTPRYMAPEQMTDGIADARADLFAFCVTCFEALASKPPHEGDGWTALAEAKATPPAIPDRSVVPSKVWSILIRGLQPDPSRRPASMPALLEELTAAARPRRRVLLPAALGVLAAAGIVWGLTTRARPACEHHGDDPWTRRRVQALADLHTRGSDTVVRVDTLLAAYGQAWVDAQHRACADEDGDRRRQALACLRRTEAELDAAIDSFADARTDAVASAVELTPIASCAQENPEVVPEAIADAVEAESVELSRISVLRRTDRVHEAFALARGVVSRSDELGHAPLRVKARLRAANAAESAGAYDEARALRDDAYSLATTARLDRLAAQAAAQLAAHTAQFGPLDETERWVALSEALLVRAGDDDTLRFKVLSSVASGYEALDRIEEAVAAHERAVEAAADNPAIQEVELSSARGNLANAYVVAGDYTRARALAEVVLATEQRLFGDHHVRIAEAWSRIARIEIESRHTDRGLELSRRALDIARTALGARHPRALNMENVFASTLIRAGRYDEAIEHLEHALDGLASVPEAVIGDRARTMTNLCVALRKAGRPLEGLEHCRTALAEAEAIFGANAFAVAVYVTNLAGAEGKVGNIEEAARLAERSLQLFERWAPDHARSIAPMLVLGTAQNELGQHDEAMANYARAEALARTHQRHSVVLEAVRGIAEAEAGRGNPQRAAELLERGVAEARAHDIATAKAEAELAAYVEEARSRSGR